jgi:hypothetical protein
MRIEFSPYILEKKSRNNKFHEDPTRGAGIFHADTHIHTLTVGQKEVQK